MTEPEKAKLVRELIAEADRRPSSFEGVVSHLMRLGDASYPAVPMLTRKLGDGQDGVRQLAAEGLGRILPGRRAAGSLGRHYHRAVDALTRRLDDDWDFVRFHAAVALGRLGDAGGGRVVPLLVRELDGESDLYRRYAAEALAGIGVQAPDAAAALIQALAHWDPDIRDRTWGAVLRAGTAAVLALLVAAARSPRDVVRAEAERMIRRIGDGAREPLSAAANGPEADLAGRAAALLADIPDTARR